ncbi:MAG TPA: NADH-quinone oxidoreductase subunit N [Blastocatellia bacterium]|nr:NADH-quinone oxidoreductase subunit N [Blastocatellia bacterium]
MLALLQAATDLSAIARQTVQYITPEVILTVFACGALILDVLLPRAHKRWVAWTCLAGLGFASVSLIILYTDIVRKGSPRTAFFDMIVVDNYAVVFKAVFLVGAALSILLSIKYLETEGEQRGEYYALILFSVIGMMFMASAVDLLSLFISLELMAVSVYILVGYLRRDKRSSEAAMKYFLLGAFSSGVLLYGISLIYGMTGTTNLAKIAAALPIVASPNFNPLGTPADVRYLVLMAMILMSAGMFFKIAAVPFHMWAPDAYEGAPTPVTAFMSVAVKAASFAMFGRLFLYGLPDLRSALAGDPATGAPVLPGWALLLGVVAAITIVWGNLAALTQQNTKRLLAYSSISHAGYTLTGLVAGNQTGYTGFIIYMVVYTLTNIGVFGCIIALRRHGIVGDRLEDLNGLMKKAPLLTVMMTVFLLSLGGIPATAGFIGKFYLFGGLIETGNPWLVRLAILAVVMSVVSLYYYIRFIRAMYIEPEAEAQPVLMAAPLRVAMAVAVLLVVFIGVYPQPVISFTQRAAASPGFRTAGSPPPTPPAQAAPPGSKGQPAPPENDGGPMRLPQR